MRIVTANVNGIRAAARRGGPQWLASREADVLLLQEVRATPEQLVDELADTPLAVLHVAHAPAADLGRAGVAVLTRGERASVRVGLPDGAFADSGRWIEAVVSAGPGGAPLTVASVYVPKGGVGTPAQGEKHAFLDAVTRRLEAATRAGESLLVGGDVNVGHTEHDIKNHKGNVGKAGFLPEERAHLDRWVADGEFVDVVRAAHGPGPGPYTWWSWRGKAFDNDSGWRIDLQLASREVAATVRAIEVGRSESYAQRWSDHAAVVVDYGD